MKLSIKNVRKSHNHTKPIEAKKIIALFNQKYSISQIAEHMRMSWDQVSKVIKDASYLKKTKPRINQQWKKPIQIYATNFETWYKKKELIRQLKIKKSNYGKEQKWKHFADFVAFTYYNKLVCGKRVKRSVFAYLKLYTIDFPTHDRPSKSQVYNWIHSNKYGLFRNYFKNMLKQVKPKKPKSQVRLMKYESIEVRPDKVILQNTPGNRLADSVEGKKGDFQLLATMLDQNTGKFAAHLYTRSSEDFLRATKLNLSTYSEPLRHLTIDNGSENAKLGELLNEARIFNCHAYCSWEKGELENCHRILRMVWPKGTSLNRLTDKDVQEAVDFVNSYYRPRYNKEVIKSFRV